MHDWHLRRPWGVTLEQHARRLPERLCVCTARCRNDRSSLRLDASRHSRGSSLVTTTWHRAALKATQQKAFSCEYAIPQPAMGTLDYDKVNVQYTPGGGGDPARLRHDPRVSGSGRCSAERDQPADDRCASRPKCLHATLRPSESRPSANPRTETTPAQERSPSACPRR